jgi:poly(3-hydroxybutyrate) depolymerase
MLVRLNASSTLRYGISAVRPVALLLLCLAGCEPEVASEADAGAPPGAACSVGTLRAGDTTRTVQVGGASRTFILHVPASYAGNSPVPLVLDWHPIFGTGAGERSGSGYARLSDAEGFIVAFPNGIDGAWNVGPCCTLSRSVDDVAFARAIVKDIQNQVCIDSKRVYTTGFSMGGGMSHYLACHAADVFAAAAPASFDLLTEDEQPCKPARPITVISFRGTFDFVVPYAGGASNPPNGLPTIHFRGAVGTFERWKELNGCTGTAVTANGCQTYTNCKDGVETTLCTIQGGGHSYGDANLGWTTMKRHSLP